MPILSPFLAVNSITRILSVSFNTLQCFGATEQTSAANAYDDAIRPNAKSNGAFFISPPVIGPVAGVLASNRHFVVVKFSPSGNTLTARVAQRFRVALHQTCRGSPDNFF